MTAKITGLINKQDNAQAIRDLIATILLVEVAGQKVLAEDGGFDPALWDMDIYTERSNAVESFLNTTDNEKCIVNIAIANTSQAGNASNALTQKVRTTYWIDCLGNGISRDNESGGHVPGDYIAAINCQRCSQLVRNILMSGVHAWFCSDSVTPGLIGHTSIQSIEYGDIENPSAGIQNIKGARISYTVDHAETSYQYSGVALAGIDIKVKREIDGKLILEAEYPKS